jgi:hypothetical protein
VQIQSKHFLANEVYEYLCHFKVSVRSCVKRDVLELIPSTQELTEGSHGDRRHYMRYPPLPI